MADQTSVEHDLDELLIDRFEQMPELIRGHIAAYGIGASGNLADFIDLVARHAILQVATRMATEPLLDPKSRVLFAHIRDGLALDAGLTMPEAEEEEEATPEPDPDPEGIEAEDGVGWTKPGTGPLKAAKEG